MTRLKVLGSGDAFASGGKYCTSFFLESDSFSGLIDCGASTLIRMKQMDLDPSELDFILITHFHGDHFGGLPFIAIANKYDQPRTKPLTIIGPIGIEDRVRQLQEIMYPGSSEIFDDQAFRFQTYSSDWFTLNNLEIMAIPVKHSPPSHPHGVKMKWDKKTIAFSGDTEWTDSLIELAQDTEVMICECNNLDKETPGHLSLHTLNEKIGELRTKKLLLSHMGPEMLASEDVPFEKLEDGQTIDLW